MVTKLKAKRQKIGSRIQRSYFIIIGVFFISTVIIFSSIFRSYIISQARENLKTAGQVLTERMANYPTENNKRVIADLRVLSRYESTNFLLTDKNDTIIYGNEALNGMTLDDALKSSESKDEIIYEVFEVEGNMSNRYNQLVIFTSISEITQINRVIIRGVVVALMITSIVAILISIVIRGKLTKPLRTINQSLDEYKENPNARPSINTNDEFEDLSDNLSLLMNRIENVKDQQKLFFQNASHELKTPLMSIQGYAEAIRDGVVEKEDEENSLNIIIAESQRLKGIVEEMILLTKLDDVKETFNFEKCSLIDILNDAKTAVNPLLISSGVELIENLDQNAIGYFDKEKITRVFINLLSNGSRYAKGKVHISIQKKGDQIYVDVMDDGPGFEVGSEDQIFDRFYKSESSGSGIGLSLCKTIVERHNGTIRAVNNVGMGALFKMTFPVGVKI